MPETTAKGNALSRGERLQIMLDADELIAIDDFRFAAAHAQPGGGGQGVDAAWTERARLPDRTWRGRTHDLLA